MELVSADRLAKQIIDKYFRVGGFDAGATNSQGSFDGDTRQDFENYLRNFIVDEQEKYQYLHERESTREVTETTPAPVQIPGASGNTDETYTDDEPSSDTDSDLPPLEDLAENDVPEAITPDGFYMVDLISVFLVTRELYEDYRKQPFVSYYVFYGDLFPPKSCQGSSRLP